MNMSRLSSTDAYHRRLSPAGMPSTLIVKFLWCFWNSR